MTSKSKRRSIALGIFLVLAIAAGGAYAYWTNTGTGTGSATTASGPSTTLSVSVTGITGLTPGGTAKPINGTITNSSDSGTKITSLTATVAPTTAWQAGCSAADYSIGGSPLTVSGSMAPGGTFTIPAGLTLSMNNLATDQNGCKGQALTVTVTAS